jgi:predicted phage terminase large subunit-like protein
MRRISPQPGPQTTFSATPADIAIYGGSAGGGKTWALAYEAARYASVPNYAGVIFRRTSPELTGGGSIWSESHKLYPHLRGVPRESPALDWRFPGQALIEFRHAQHEVSVHAYQSKQWDFIGFDELTHFTSYQFWYLLSRLRSGSAQVPKRVRASCNPDPDSFVRGLIDWYIGENGIAIASRSGVIRWFVRLDERLVWGASPDEVWARDKFRIRRRGEPALSPTDMRPEPMSFTFIRASVTDNRILLDNDPGYVARLNLLPGAQAKRLRDGNWNARDSAGDYFDRSWCRIVSEVNPLNIVRRVRFWDKAATSPSNANPDPDWTRGPLLYELDSGHYVFADLASCREGPAEVDQLMLRTAQMDGITVELGAWIDPGQAGKVDDLHMQTLLRGYPYQGIAARENKVTYASVWTGLAKKGRLWFLRREYLPEVFAELEGFPLRAHDDIMDGVSGCFQKLIGVDFVIDYEAAPDHRHPGRGTRDEDDDDDERDSSRGVYF